MRSLLGVSIGWLGISLVADSVPSLLVPFRMADGDASATEIGLITLMGIGLAALIQPLAGASSDRRGRVPIVVGGIAVAIGGLATLAVGGVLIGTILALGGVAIAQAGYQALLPDRVPPSARGRASGAKGFFDVGGAFVGFVIVGAALSAAAVGLAALVLAIGLAGALIIGVLLLGRRPKDSTAESLSDGHALESAPLVRLTVARFLFLLGIYAVGRFLLLYVGDRLGLPPNAAAAYAGAVLAVLAFLTAATALPAGWIGDRLGRRPLMVAGGAIAAVGIAGLPSAGSLPSIVAMGALMAIGTAAFGAGSWAALADATAGPHAGKRLGLANLGTAGAAAAAGLFGPLIDAAGFGVAFSIAAFAVVAGGVVAGVIGPQPSLAPIEARR